MALRRAGAAALSTPPERMPWLGFGPPTSTHTGELYTGLFAGGAALRTLDELAASLLDVPGIDRAAVGAEAQNLRQIIQRRVAAAWSGACVRKPTDDGVGQLAALLMQRRVASPPSAVRQPRVTRDHDVDLTWPGRPSRQP
jgi:hypothetical protein